MFGAIVIIRAINNEADCVKASNYWRWLKKKLGAENIQLVSVTHDFKFESPDGKKRLSKCVDWSKIPKNDYLNAMIESHSDTTKIKTLLRNALTDKINDREVFYERQ